MMERMMERMCWSLMDGYENVVMSISEKQQISMRTCVDRTGAVFTSASPQTSSPLSPLHFLLFRSSSLSWLPLHVFFSFTSSSSSSSPPAGLCEQSLFSFLFSSFSSSWNPLLIYVHINYFSFVISTVGHDTILWARVHPPPHPTMLI